MAQIIEFFGNHPMLLAALAATIVFIVISEIRARMGPGPVTTASAVRFINDNDAVMLDIRPVAEYKSGHILSAKNVPLAKLTDDIGNVVKDKARTIIVYCKSGNQSAAAALTLSKQGYEQVFYLKGGLYSWQQDNLPMEK